MIYISDSDIVQWYILVIYSDRPLIDHSPLIFEFLDRIVGRLSSFIKLAAGVS